MTALFWSFTGGALALLLSGFTSIDFSLPTNPWGDHTFLLLMAKNMMHGSLWSNSDLGRPGTFLIYAFPLPDMLQHAILWLSTLIARNPFEATHAYYILIILLTYWSAFFALWKFFKNTAFSFFGGILFLFIPYLSYRSGVGHDYLAAYYAAPWAFIICQAMTQDLSFLKKWEVLLGAAIIGLSGVYYLAFSLILFCFYSLINNGWHWRSLLQCGAISLLCLTFFSIAMYPSLHFVTEHNLPLPPRQYIDQPVYSTKIADLLWTMGQHMPDNPKIAAYMQYRGSAEGYDFWPGIILSIFGLFSILFYNPQQKKIRAILNFMTLTLLFSTPFGIGFLFNLLATPVIRSQGRMSPFFTFGVILVLGYQLRHILHTSTIKIAGALFVLTLINGWPYFGFYSGHQKQTLSSANYQQETYSLYKLLEKIHSKKFKQIAQLPITPWPEVGNQLEFSPYDHLLPYIYDTLPSQTSWSYGLMGHDPQFAILQKAGQEQNPTQFIKNFVCLGFDSILIQKAAYTSDELRVFKTALAALTHTEHEDDRRLLLSLNIPCSKK